MANIMTARFSLRKRRTLHVAALITCIFLQLRGLAADAVHHVDGMVVTGKIKSETPDAITIETKYGPLTYDKTKVLKIERDADAARAAAQKARATPVNYSFMIPVGPINPFAPPQIQPLAKFALQPAAAVAVTTATAPAPLPGVPPTPPPAQPPSP